MSIFNEHEKEIAELEVSARKGNLAKVQKILDSWPSPSDYQASLQSALWHSIRGGQVPVASHLLVRGAKVRPDISGSAVSSTTSIEMFQLLLDYGWNINSKTDIGIPVFALAVQSQSTPLVHWFLSHGADPSFRGSRAGVPGAHMLDVAAAGSTPAILDLLINHGLHLSHSDALHSAAGSLEAPPGRIEMMDYLLDRGMNIDAIEKVGLPGATEVGKGTPLHSAVYIDNEERVAFLLEKGADPRVKNDFGEDAAKFASRQESWKTLKLLQGR